MLRRWFKKHLLTVGLDALQWQRPDNSLEVFPLKAADKQLMPDLQDLSVQLDTITDQLQGNSVSVQIRQPLVRYQILPWQKSMVRQQDWLALVSQHFKHIYGAVAQQWQYQVHFQGYGQPVLAMGISGDLLALIDEQAKKSRWQFKGVEPELLAVADQHRRKLKSNDWLLLCDSSDYFLLSERKKKRWLAIHVFSAGGMSLENSVEVILKQRRQSYESLPALTVWTDTSGKLPLHLADLKLKPLNSDSSGSINNSLPGNT